jgi:hypothetical protein
MVAVGDLLAGNPFIKKLLQNRQRRTMFKKLNKNLNKKISQQTASLPGEAALLTI